MSFLLIKNKKLEKEVLDMDFVYALIIVVAVLAIAIGVLYAVRKNYISSKDLEIIKNVFNLSTAIIDELNLKQEDLIMQISQIVLSSLDFAIVISNNNDEIKDAAYNQACQLCSDFKIELTESRKMIIKQLIEIGMSNIYELDEQTSKYVRA